MVMEDARTRTNVPIVVAAILTVGLGVTLALYAYGYFAMTRQVMNNGRSANSESLTRFYDAPWIAQLFYLASRVESCVTQRNTQTTSPPLVPVPTSAPVHPRRRPAQ